MRPGSLSSLLRAAFAILQREAPRSYRRLAGILSGIRIRFRFPEEGGETVLAFLPFHVFLDAPSQPAEVEIATDRSLVLDLVCGRLDLEDALRSDRLLLLGSVGVLPDFLRALHAFVSGAAQCPSFPGLLADLEPKPERT